MIQANELRIGNWVMELGWDENREGEIVGDPEGNKPVQVALWLLKYIEDGNPAQGGITRYDGIPLNAEILEKAGFVKDIEGNYRMPSFRWEFIIDPDDLTLSFREDIGLPYHSFPVETIYLHQLQNLYFALTGEELKIEL